MFSILDLQHRSPDLAPEPSIEEQLEPQKAGGAAEEFEFILGRRQIASVLFVFTIVLMICIAVSYLAGKSMPAKAPAPAPAPVATVVPAPEPPPILLNQEPLPAAPLFAAPKNGSVYIQMGAVEKGVAAIFAEGLRTHGLESFVAPGPNDKIFRVLIGPLADPAAYTRAKDAVDKIGLATFARRFPN
jgi:hypothetical protein